MTKSLRPGKVLIDWSQNDEHKTTVNVYSLRAKERPTVSTPVSWDEVEAASRRRSRQGAHLRARRRARRGWSATGDLFAPALTTAPGAAGAMRFAPRRFSGAMRESRPMCHRCRSTPLSAGAARGCPACGDDVVARRRRARLSGRLLPPRMRAVAPRVPRSCARRRPMTGGAVATGKRFVPDISLRGADAHTRLATYLNDHLGGSATGRELARRTLSEQPRERVRSGARGRRRARSRRTSSRCST